MAVEAAAAAVLDVVPSAVVLVGVDGRIEAWNTAAGVLYGADASDVVGRDFVDVLFDADDRVSAAELVASGEPWDGDRRVRRADGVLLVSSFRARPLAGGGLAWIATDGMDQGLAEQERAVLLSAERAARDLAEEALGLVEAILGSAPVGIAVFDLDLRLVRVNDAFVALSGAAVGDTAGALTRFPASFSADLRRAVSTGRTILDRPLVVDAGGRTASHFVAGYFPVRTATGVLVGAGATIVDVTEAKRVEAERATLLRRTEAAQERLAVLAAASTVLTATMDVDALLRDLAGVLAPAAADWCVIQLSDGEGMVEHVAVAHAEPSAAKALDGHLRASPLPLLTTSGSRRQVLVGPDAVAGLQSPALSADVRPRAGVAVPVGWRDQHLGMLVLARQGPWEPESDDVDLTIEVAHRASLALGNAFTFQREHEIAERLQRALLPSALPSVPGVRLTTRYLAATDRASVGGDWYDAVDFGEGKLGVVIGDVVGHDIEASTVMGQVRNALRAYAHDEPGQPAGAVARLDRLIDSLGLPPATCVLGVVDTVAPSFRWSNAGHLPPLLLRRGKATFLRDGAGMMLGVTAGAHAAEASTELVAGDVLVLYTDGLVERRGEPLDRGLERLAGAAAGLAVLDGTGVADALLSALMPPSEVLDDDIALLVVHVGGSSAPGHRLDLRLEPSSAAVARGFTAGVLEAAGWGSVVDTSALLVSELVTNAVRHGAPPCSLELWFPDDDTLEVVVEDGNGTIPEPRAAHEFAESGRGLLLVDGMADSWGVRASGAGKQTWFRVRRRPVP